MSPSTAQKTSRSEFEAAWKSAEQPYATSITDVKVVEYLNGQYRCLLMDNDHLAGIGSKIWERLTPQLQNAVAPEVVAMLAGYKAPNGSMPVREYIRGLKDTDRGGEVLSAATRILDAYSPDPDGFPRQLRSPFIAIAVFGDKAASCVSTIVRIIKGWPFESKSRLSRIDMKDGADAIRAISTGDSGEETLHALVEYLAGPSHSILLPKGPNTNGPNSSRLGDDTPVMIVCKVLLTLQAVGKETVAKVPGARATIEGAAEYICNLAEQSSKGEEWRTLSPTYAGVVRTLIPDSTKTAIFLLNAIANFDKPRPEIDAPVIGTLGRCMKEWAIGDAPTGIEQQAINHLAKYLSGFSSNRTYVASEISQQSFTNNIAAFLSHLSGTSLQAGVRAVHDEVIGAIRLGNFHAVQLFLEVLCSNRLLAVIQASPQAEAMKRLLEGTVSTLGAVVECEARMQGAGAASDVIMRLGFPKSGIITELLNRLNNRSPAGPLSLPK